MRSLVSLLLTVLVAAATRIGMPVLVVGDPHPRSPRPDGVARWCFRR